MEIALNGRSRRHSSTALEERREFDYQSFRKIDRLRRKEGFYLDAVHVVGCPFCDRVGHRRPLPIAMILEKGEDQVAGSIGLLHSGNLDRPVSTLTNKNFTSRVARGR